MNIYDSIVEYYKAVYRAAKEIKPKEVYISTFSLYAGISKCNVDVRIKYGYPNRTADFLDKLVRTKVETNIVVGLIEQNLCTPDCTHCIKKWNQTVDRFIYTRDNWPDFNWKFVNENHTKFMVLKNKENYKVFSGGRNLSNSGWDDLMFDLPDEMGPGMLKRYYKLLKKPIVELEDLYVKCGT